MSSLSGKRALVTGGGRGIGAAIVRRLAGEGASVAVNYRSDAKSAQALAAELKGAGDIVTVQADVSDPQGRWRTSPSRTTTGCSASTWPGSCSSPRPPWP